MSDKPNSSTVDVSLNSERIVRVMFVSMVLFEVFLVLLDAFLNYGKLIEIGAIRRLSNIAREDGLGTWFASTQTFLAGLTAMAVWYLSKKLDRERLYVIGWLVIACFFIFMAADDGAQIHERMGTTFKAIAKGSDGLAGSILGLSPSYTWQLLFVPIFGSIGLFMAYILWKELGSSRTRMLVIAALACMGTAVILDFFEGLDKKHAWNIYAWLAENYELRNYTVWHFAKVIEEFLEMLSITTFWLIFSRQLFFLMKPVEVRLKVSGQDKE